MPFRLPTFNLTCNIWWNTPPAVIPPAAPPDLAAVPCQLRLLKTAFLTAHTLGTNLQPMFLAVPPLTDIRPMNGWGLTTGSNWAVCEVPAGSQRWYWILDVDDSAKGFPNEYRVANLAQIVGSPPPVPIP